jgi:hypothetical protein
MEQLQTRFGSAVILTCWLVLKVDVQFLFIVVLTHREQQKFRYKEVPVRYGFQAGTCLCQITTTGKKS